VMAAVTISAIRAGRDRLGRGSVVCSVIVHSLFVAS
jgi:hypothetical protein